MAKKKLKQKSSATADIVYDDDTSSSSDSENLQAFHQIYPSKEVNNAPKYSSSDADDEVNENTSDEDESSDQTSSDSSEADEPSLMRDSLLQNAHTSSKVEKLRSQLRTLSKVNNDDNSKSNAVG